MFSQAVLLSVLAALAEARFGQEQLPISAISGVTSGGAPGAASTLAGQSISTLLAAANPCAKLQQADKIITELGTGADALAAAIGLVAAEQNFNPFAVDIPSVCSDASLPATEALRGIVPLVDPAVGGAATENANSAASAKAPFDATGLSVADVMAAQGFTNFTTKDLAGNVGAAPAAGAAAAAAPAAADAAVATDAAAEPAAVVACGGAPPAAAAAADAAPEAAADAAPAAAAAAAPAAAAGGAVPAQGVAPAFVASSITALDFGLCVPTIKFEESLNGRKAGEFTFQAQDPIVNKGQQEALNPNIITKRICDQLGNVCEANAAAKTACTAAAAQIAGLGTRDQATADAWNTALGFAGANTNPDNAPQPGLIGHA